MTLREYERRSGELERLVARTKWRSRCLETSCEGVTSTLQKVDLVSDVADETPLSVALSTDALALAAEKLYAGRDRCEGGVHRAAVRTISPLCGTTHPTAASVPERSPGHTNTTPPCVQTSGAHPSCRAYLLKR